MLGTASGTHLSVHGVKAQQQAVLNTKRTFVLSILDSLLSGVKATRIAM